MNESALDKNMPNKCPQCGAALPGGALDGLCPACLLKQGAETGPAAESLPFQPPAVGEVARLFPQLEIIAFIGKGGMGAVYQARQPALDRMVALKILPPQAAGGAGFAERFNREARALARLSHPNIVAVYEFGQVNGLPFFIMEFVDGLNLRELERAGKLSAREALQIVPQICEALQFAHDEGIVHRDIKPENILLDKKGRVKIADFGIAKILGGTPEAELTQTKAALGTPHYMAPEQMEKPATVDHRADIFSLGVVFYEMLTGELPLGKFAPPSARKVEVDVRLDDVVLRALEKDPERRYQHASQVKTAVDTIAGSTAPPPPAANGTAMAQEILARDYSLNIRSCLRRGWTLLKGEFWPFVGITALIMALLSFASSMGGSFIWHASAGDLIGRASASGHPTETASAVAMLVWGPLVGGLLFYFLKKIRREPATVETAFCGFSHRFLHLFLAGFVTSLLTALGIVCLLLPGIYLLIAWMFALPLVMDKQLDFWSAMELSRKVVTRHWFKFLGFGLVLWLLALAGAVALVIGVFVMCPLILASLMYAYEDIFGGVAPAAAPQVGTGPSGTVVMPGTPLKPSRAPGQTWTTETTIGVAAVALVIGFVALSRIDHLVRAHRQREALSLVAPKASEPQMPPPSVQPVSLSVFGPVMERELTDLAAINLASGRQNLLPQSVTEQSRGPQKDSAACAWLEQAGMDFAYVSEYDGFYSMTRDMITLKRDDWENATPETVADSLHDTGQDVAAKFGDSSRLNNPTNFTYGFKTRDGSVGLLQVTGFTENPPRVKIHYKRFQPAATVAANANAAVSARSGDMSREALSERLEAASSINNYIDKEQPLAAVAIDAAKAGEVEIVKKSIAQIYTRTKRDDTTHEAALLLAKRGLRKQAIELAKGIYDMATRNQTLSELAQQHPGGVERSD